jgi:hypothetical protein
MRHGPRQFSWFIFRVTNPTMRAFLHATQRTRCGSRKRCCRCWRRHLRKTPIWPSIFAIRRSTTWCRSAACPHWRLRRAPLRTSATSTCWTPRPGLVVIARFALGGALALTLPGSVAWGPGRDHDRPSAVLEGASSRPLWELGFGRGDRAPPRLPRLRPVARLPAAAALRRLPRPLAARRPRRRARPAARVRTGQGRPQPRRVGADAEPRQRGAPRHAGPGADARAGAEPERRAAAVAGLALAPRPAPAAARCGGCAALSRGGRAHLLAQPQPRHRQRRRRLGAGPSGRPGIRRPQVPRLLLQRRPDPCDRQRAAYQAAGGYGGWRALAATSRRIGTTWVGAFVRYDNLRGAAFEASPLVRRDHQVTVGLGVSWVFASSAQQVWSSD